MIRIQGVRFFGAIFHSRERSSLAAEVQQYVRTITSQHVRLPRVKYMVGLDTPDMIVRPRPPKPSLGDSERVYYENVRSSIANKFDAENAAVVIKRCLSDKQLKVMPHVFDECLARNIALESDLLLHLFEQFSGHYMFDAACTVAVQLVRANVKDIDPSLISLALAGSLSTESVRKAADLLFALVRARREDLLQSAGSVKVTLPDSGTKSWPKQENNAVDCELGVQLFVAALRDGWFSAPACRQFVSILLTPQVLGGPHINKLFSDCIACAVESKLSVFPILHAFAEIPPPPSMSSGSREFRAYGELMSSIQEVLIRIVKSYALNCKLREDGPLLSLTSPLECENFLKLYWKTASLVQRYDIKAIQQQENELAVSLNDLHSSLKDFRSSDALGATFSIPWGHQRRAFRVLADLLGFNHKIRDKEYAIDLMKINVFKDGKPKNRRSTAVQFASMQSIATTNKLREDTSPYILVSAPPEWHQLSVLLADTVDSDVLMTVFASALQVLKDRHSNPVWAICMLESILSRREPTAIPQHAIEGILQMCMYKTDIYSILEILSLVRERGIKLSETTWSKIMVVMWTGGTRHMTPISRDRVFVQLIELMKHCNGKLDGPSVAVLMRYLYFKQEHNDSFLYKIVDRLYKDKSQDITFKECSVLCACLYKRNKFLGASKYFELSRPLFATSRFISVSEMGEIKLYDDLYDMVKYFPDGFFNQFADIWASISSEQGRSDLYSLAESLLFDEQISFLVTVPVHEQLRNTLCVLSVYSAFLVGHNDKLFRKSFDMLHRISTLYRQFEHNKRKRHIYEYSCPRQYNSLEPLSHFSFGWAESDSDSDSEKEFAAPSSSVQEVNSIDPFSSIGDRSTGSTIQHENESNLLANSDVMTVDELRIRAGRNIYKETMRSIDVKKTNQPLKAATAYRTVERLRFIPERS